MYGENMKVLWLGRNVKQMQGRSVPHLRSSLGQLVTLKVSQKIEEKPLAYDVVVIGVKRADLPKYAELTKWAIPKVMICSDPYQDFKYHAYYAEKYKINLALLVCGSWIPFYRKRLSCTVDRLPWCLNDVCTNTKKDITLAYATSANRSVYPIRNLMNKDKRLSQFKTVKFGAGTGKRLKWTTYMEVLNRSKILAFGNSIWRYALQKYFEGFSTKNLVISPTPKDAEKLHFKPYENYVPITQENYFEVISEYVKNENERKKIAEDGRETFLKYHTSQIRAKQLFQKLKRLLNV